MSAHQLLSAVAVLAAVSSAEDIEVCGLRSARGSPFVRNGEVASNSTEVPWNVAVYDLSAVNGPLQICGGSLIKSNYFVSAAHCFHQKTYRRPVSDFVATVGKRYRDLNTTEDTEQRVQLQRIFYHTYGGSNGLYRNDIAVVQLAQDVSISVNVLPICIDWRNKLPKLETGLLGLVAGFGGYRNNPYETLRYSMLPYLELEDCRRNLSSTLRYYTAVQDKFCVGVTNGSAAGPGDSGGGLAFETAGQWFLRGIVSLGDAINVGNSFFTDVSEHIPWMSQITQGLVVPNLTPACLQCLCHTITGCNMTFGCTKGYCGPFYISRVFWKDAGKPLLPEDDPVRPGAYEDCAQNYACAASAVTQYMSKFGRDCNGDGIADCDDFLMIHFNGANGCNRSLANSVDPMEGSNLTAKYESCRPVALSRYLEEA